MLSDQIYSLDLPYLQSLSLKDIEKKLNEFPFSANLRMLKLLALKSQHAENFDQELQLEAALIPDRVLLKKRLSKIEESFNNPTGQIDNPKIDTIEGLEKINPTLELILKEPNLSSDSEKADMSIQNQKNLPQEIIEIVQIDDGKQIIKTKIHLPNTNESNEFSEQLESEASINIKQDFMPDEVKIVQPILIEEELSDFAKWLKSQSASKSIEISQTDLNEITNEKPVVANKISVESIDNEWQGLQEKILSEYQTDLGSSDSKTSKKSKITADKKKKKEKEKPDETTIITETYALLLEKQQKYQKALKIYDKLCLLFPEKRHYFAQKIEILKNL